MRIIASCIAINCSNEIIMTREKEKMEQEEMLKTVNIVFRASRAT